MRDKKITDEHHFIPKKHGNGQIRREVWVDSSGHVTRYNFAYINHHFFHGDHGRVVGYDNAHGFHHRHFFGQVEPFNFTCIEDVERQFERDWTTLGETNGPPDS